MSNAHGLTKENLLFTFPAVLRENPSIAALGDVTMEALAKRPTEISRLSIYPRIDELPEKLLDILAHDYKVDWWDPNFTLEEKRRVFKDSWKVHKTLGTKAAVETAIRAIYPLTTVEEWFEYGGEPYHFRLNIDITSDSGDRERQRRVLERLNFYKNLRSHNDGVRYFLVPEKSWAVAGGLFAGSREVDRASVKVPELRKPGGQTIAIAGGGLAGSRSEGNVRIKAPELLKPGGKTTVTTGGGFTGSRSVDRASIRVPALKRPGAGAALITGGGFTGYRRRIDAAVSMPPLTRPRGAAERTAATGFVGSVGRVTVRLDASAVRVPTGRAATGGTAGVFHSYQRMRVTVFGAPAQAQQSGLRGERTSNGLERMPGEQPGAAERSL